VCLNGERYTKHYIEEYMPSYIILSSDIKDFKNIAEYINEYTDCELIVTGNYKKFEELIIDEMEAEKISGRRNEYKFINQQIISFYSVQGGVGKTSIAFNLAWFLKDLANIKILVIDLNFCEGPSDLSANLNLPLSHNLSLFIENISDGQDALAKSVC